MRRREFLGLFGGLSITIVSGAAHGGEALKRVALVSVGSTPVTQMHEGSTSVYFRTFFEGASSARIRGGKEPCRLAIHQWRSERADS